ncbi:MAG: hypothetical protein EA379_07755 [Phycisphaerales bacterium]|nr:MAG: hypothetical protein EA379_07755 [Phycisphaerales bacterium]
MTEHERREWARLLRCAADDELTTEESEAVSSREGDSGADDAARIAFERALREAVGRVMGGSAKAPQSLRDRVERAMLEERTRHEVEAGADGVAGTIRPMRTRLRQWPLAAAAAVLIGTMLVMAVQRGGFGGAPAIPEHQVQLTSFLQAEHEGCAGCPVTLREKLQTRELLDATELVWRTVGEGVAALDLSASGYVFSGVGKCRVPGPGASVHLMYLPEKGAAGGAPVSLFVQVHTGDREVPEGLSRLLECRKKSELPVLMWRHGDVLYYVVSPSEIARDTVGASMGAPIRG